MKALRVHGPDDLRLDEIDRPRAGPDDVVVRVAACGICGSDLSYTAVGGLSGPADAPLCLGHEFAGVIEEVGERVRGLRPGQRVAVNPTSQTNMIGAGGPGAFAPFIRVRDVSSEALVHPIPDALPFETAALIEPLAVALHGVNRSGARAGDKVVVLGAGPIGLGIVWWLAQRGVQDVVAVDLSDYRLELARRLGARHALHAGRVDLRAVLGELHGSGSIFGWPCVNTDVFIEASGAPGAIPDVVAMARFHAHLAVVAVHHRPVAVDFQTLLGKEMVVTTSMGYPDEFAQVVDVLGQGRLDVAPLISHRYVFDDVLAAFATARDKQRAAKVMVGFPL
jgi:2-desacetyl-2-hydroxyethyl bacteriochlorophyllide A dehydrogenase